MPIEQEEYNAILDDNAKFRKWLADNHRQHPELFPAEMERGFIFNGKRSHKKLLILPD
ncbi:MAG: hypothetical protein LBL62_09225 [Planctomycetaceae bacterium]|nr:hypothetical protein [Planctomycetaceae bacterium]